MQGEPEGSTSAFCACVRCGVDVAVEPGIEPAPEKSGLLLKGSVLNESRFSVPEKLVDSL